MFKLGGEYRVDFGVVLGKMNSPTYCPQFLVPDLLQSRHNPALRLLEFDEVIPPSTATVSIRYCSTTSSSIWSSSSLQRTGRAVLGNVYRDRGCSDTEILEDGK